MSLGFGDALIYSMEIFQQENAGRTVHLWQAEGDIHLPGTPELQQLVYHGFIIQVCEIAAYKFSLCLDAR